MKKKNKIKEKFDMTFWKYFLHSVDVFMFGLIKNITPLH